jgi:transcriptional regulator with XRE-family HTH domain
MYHNITDGIRSLRKQFGLTQAQFAEACSDPDYAEAGVSDRIVRDWENGIRFPTYRHVHNLYVAMKDKFALKPYDLYRLLSLTGRAGLPYGADEYANWVSMLTDKNAEDGEFALYSQCKQSSWGELLSKITDWRKIPKTTLARRLRVDRSTVFRWCTSGKVVPSAPQFEKICAVLRMPTMLRILLYEKLCEARTDDLRKII